MKYVEFSHTFNGFQYRRSSESLDLQFNLYLACTECTYVCTHILIGMSSLTKVWVYCSLNPPQLWQLFRPNHISLAVRIFTDWNCHGNLRERERLPVLLLVLPW